MTKAVEEVIGTRCGWSYRVSWYADTSCIASLCVCDLKAVRKNVI